MSVKLLNPWDYKVYFALTHSDKKHWTLHLSFLKDLTEPDLLLTKQIAEGINYFSFLSYLFYFCPVIFLVKMLAWPRFCFQSRSCFDLQQFILKRCIPVISFLTLMVDSNKEFLKIQKAQNTVIIPHWDFFLCSKSYNRVTFITASTMEGI